MRHTDGDFAWCDPPLEVVGQKGRVPEREPVRFLARLRGRPGTWARLRIYHSYSAAQRAIEGLDHRYRAEGFEFARSRAGVWGRWVGMGGGEGRRSL